jgi:hypothetical protein
LGALAASLALYVGLRIALDNQVQKTQAKVDETLAVAQKARRLANSRSVLPRAAEPPPVAAPASESEAKPERNRSRDSRRRRRDRAQRRDR